MKDSRGFSLLEMLVVLLIVGLFGAMSVAWLEAGPAPMQRALEQLAADAHAQAAQARHSGQVRGLRWNGQQPEFVRWQAGKDHPRWVVDSSSPRSWPQTLRADGPVSGEPKVVFTPTGLAEPATLDWRWPQGHQRWRWSGDNSLSRVDLP